MLGDHIIMSLTGTPQHYPISMARFGLNPYGANIYRIVFAPSVRHLIGGRWRDGSVEYRSRPTYSKIGNEWILERWVSAKEFCGMTREEYEIRFRGESGLFTMGPYPYEGTYTLCGDAALKKDAIPSIGKLIEGIEHGRRNMSHARTMENYRLIAEDLAAEEKSQDDLILSRIQEKRPAFGNRPTSFRGGVHSTKSKVEMHHAAPFKGGGMKVFKEPANA